jgi:hypothetical protein
MSYPIAFATILNQQLGAKRESEGFNFAGTSMLTPPTEREEASTYNRQSADIHWTHIHERQALKKRFDDAEVLAIHRRRVAFEDLHSKQNEMKMEFDSDNEMFEQFMSENGLDAYVESFSSFICDLNNDRKSLKRDHELRQVDRRRSQLVVIRDMLNRQQLECSTLSNARDDAEFRNISTHMGAEIDFELTFANPHPFEGIE